MKSKRDVFYSCGFSVLTIIFTIILCFMTVYYIIGVDVPQRTIIQHILFSDKQSLLATPMYSAPFVCDGIFVNQWFIIFVPMLSSMPFLMQFAGEFNGFYRMQLARMSFKKYWNRVFFKIGFSGACSVTVGYAVFSLITRKFFPKLSEYPAEETMQLNSAMNRLFKTQNEFVFWLSRAVVIFTFVFLISQVCLLIFLLCMNRYKAIGLPMITFYLLDQISNSLYRNNYDGKYYIISPKNILFFTDFTFESWGFNYWWYFIFVVIVTITLYIFGKKICRGRVTN